MAVSLTCTNRYKYKLMAKLVDLASDSIKAVLCRSGFVFDQDVYDSYLNLKATTGSISVVFNSTAKTITRTTGSFITDGFVVGNQIATTSGTNDGPFTVTVVAALVLTVSETLTTETISCLITTNDEVAEGGGYYRNTTVLAGVTVTEDDPNDRCRLTCSDLSWTGGVAGFVTAGCILFDDTPAADADKTIIGYLNFDQERTVAYNMVLEVKSLVLDITYTASGTTFTATPSNHFLYQLATKKLELNVDSLKFILMATGFTFDPDTHATYADISASELAAGSGYLQNTIVLTTPVMVEDDINNRSEVSFATVSITVTGGTIGPTPGFIIYDDSSADNTVIGYWKFEAEKTDGISLDIVGIKIRLS